MIFNFKFNLKYEFRNMLANFFSLTFKLAKLSFDFVFLYDNRDGRDIVPHNNRVFSTVTAYFRRGVP